MAEKSDLTVIMPCYNEQDALPLVLPGLVSFCKERGWKIICINDGSKDNTLSVLKVKRVF